MYIEATLVKGQAEVVLEFEYEGVSYADSVVLDTPATVSRVEELGMLSWYNHPLYEAINAAMDEAGWHDFDGYWVSPPEYVLEEVE